MDELYIITLFRSLFYASIFNLNEPFNFFHNSFVCQNEMDIFPLFLFAYSVKYF